jgi:hypothetical protein
VLPCPKWTAERLKRAVKCFVAEGLIEPKLLHQAASRKISSERLVTLVAGIKRANSDLTLAQIGAQLEAMYERTPRGGARWFPSSVKSLLDRAESSDCSTPKRCDRAEGRGASENPSPRHPVFFRSRAAFAALPRSKAISTGPSENSPALAFSVRTRR